MKREFCDLNFLSCLEHWKVDLAESVLNGVSEQ